MEWHDQPAMPAPLTPAMPAPLMPAQPVVAPITPAEAPASQTTGSGIKRIVLTGALSALLLVGGAVAVVSAASPEPSSSSAPSTTEPSTPGTTTPTTPGAADPSTRPHRGSGGSTADCPNMGTDDSSGSGSGSSGSSGSPAPVETPAT